mmetsp:Transcript_65307/g.103985  ORF Transcript_65307/g.103985 Transcript_65307/m.103985 type:complete len:233 (-) Transcript_65307:659-1357(-)
MIMITVCMPRHDRHDNIPVLIIQRIILTLKLLQQRRKRMMLNNNHRLIQHELGSIQRLIQPLILPRKVDIRLIVLREGQIEIIRRQIASVYRNQPEPGSNQRRIIARTRHNLTRFPSVIPHRASSINPVRQPLSHRLIKPIIHRRSTKVITRQSFMITEVHKHRNIELIQPISQQIDPVLHQVEVLRLALIVHVMAFGVADKDNHVQVVHVDAVWVVGDDVIGDVVDHRLDD